MTEHSEQTEIGYDDIYPDRPDEARSIAHRIASVLRRHREDPAAEPETTCLCGYHGNYLGHVTRETLIGLREEGLEIRSGRVI